LETSPPGCPARGSARSGPAPRCGAADRGWASRSREDPLVEFPFLEMADPREPVSRTPEHYPASLAPLAGADRRESSTMRSVPPKTRRARSSAMLLGLLLLATALPATACGLFDKSVDVLLIGDSIMNQSGDFVLAQLRKEPSLDDVKVRKEAVNGSGLLTPN